MTIGLLAPAALAACLSYSPHEVPFSGRSLRAENLAALESRPAPERLRFAVVGDVQGWYYDARDAVRLLNGVEDLAFVVQAGDFTDLGRSYEFEQMAEIFEALAVPWFAPPPRPGRTGWDVRNASTPGGRGPPGADERWYATGS